MSELRKLTRLGGDVRKIAALLQSKGRGKDTILAHITPQEAALLKARGGRGSTNPDTGLLEFEDGEDYQGGSGLPASDPMYSDYGAGEPGMGFAGQKLTWSSPDSMPPEFQENWVTSSAQPTRGTPIPFEFQTTPEQALARLQAAPEEMLPTPPAAVPPPVPEVKVPEVPGDERTLMQKAAAKTGLSEDALARALGASIQGIGGLAMSRRAGREGQAQRAELEKLATPYRAQAQQLTAQAQAGQLTPVGQQQIEAARAKLAQAATGRGGVGAAQMATQLEAFRQQLLQQQLDMGLKLSGIADQIQMGAIRAGYQADQQVQQLTSQFYNNMFRTLFGQPSGGK